MIGPNQAKLAGHKLGQAFVEAEKRAAAELAQLEREEASRKARSANEKPAEPEAKRPNPEPLTPPVTDDEVAEVARAIEHELRRHNLDAMRVNVRAFATELAQAAIAAMPSCGPDEVSVVLTRREAERLADLYTPGDVHARTALYRAARDKLIAALRNGGEAS